MAFRIHGSVDIRREGQMLIADIGGPWNAELIDHYRLCMSRPVREVSADGGWGLILVIHGAALCPPDALEGIRRGLIEHAGKRLRRCTSYVIAPDVAGYHVMDRLWRSLYEGVMPLGIFETLDAAQVWTARQLELADGLAG